MVLALIAAAWIPNAAGQSVDEYQLKAAFLYNFARFVEWPASAFSGSSEPIGICVLGQNPFGDSLEEAIRGKKVNGRLFALRMISRLPANCTCHILFVGKSERKKFQLPPEQLRGVLSVGESPGFALEGGIVNFKLVDGRIRLEINVSVAEQEKLRISSKLLSLAEVVGRQGSAP